MILLVLPTLSMLVYIRFLHEMNPCEGQASDQPGVAGRDLMCDLIQMIELSLRDILHAPSALKPIALEFKSSFCRHEADSTGELDKDCSVSGFKEILCADQLVQVPSSSARSACGAAYIIATHSLGAHTSALSFRCRLSLPLLIPASRVLDLRYIPALVMSYILDPDPSPSMH